MKISHKTNKFTYTATIPDRLTDICHSKQYFIEHAEWGEIHVANICDPTTITVYKDAMIWSNGSVSWNWTNCGTKHCPGVTVKAMQQLLELNGPYKNSTIIISKGFENKLQVTAELLLWLNNNDLMYKILNSMDAIKLYNQMVFEGKSVCMLIHSTC